jgi:hypothetical protein
LHHAQEGRWPLRRPQGRRRYEGFGYRRLSCDDGRPLRSVICSDLFARTSTQCLI